MQIDFTGRQLEITPELRQYTQERLRKLTRIVRDGYDVHVILTAERHRRIAEVTLKFRDRALVAVHETNDARASIGGALDKVERQVVRYLERRRTRKRRPRPTTTILLNVLGKERVDHRELRILETERIPIKPMTIEEAMDAVEQSGSGAVVFRNLHSQRVNVVYRRPDGRLGLIEPEES